MPPQPFFPPNSALLSDSGLPSTPHGPLQAFGSIQRSLRETEKRITSVNGEVANIASTVDGKLQHFNHKCAQHDRKMREETRELIANVEELVMQMYDEHGRALAQQRETIAALRSQLENEGASARAALQSQQNQIDVLAAALRRQQELINEYITASGAQQSAVQAGMAELQKVVGAQGTSIDAVAKQLCTVEVQLSAQMEQRLTACDTLVKEVSRAIDARLEQHEQMIQVLMGQWSALQSKESEASIWRGAADKAISTLTARADEAATMWRAAQVGQSEARQELLARFEAEARQLEHELERSLAQAMARVSASHFFCVGLLFVYTLPASTRVAQAPAPCEVLSTT